MFKLSLHHLGASWILSWGPPLLLKAKEVDSAVWLKHSPLPATTNLNEPATRDTQCAEGTQEFAGHSSDVCSNAAEYFSGEASFAKSAPVKYHTDNRSHSDRGAGSGKQWATRGGMQHMWHISKDHWLKAKMGIPAAGQTDCWGNKTIQRGNRTGCERSVSKPPPRLCVFANQLGQREPSVCCMWQNFWCSLVSRRVQLHNCHTGEAAYEGSGRMENGHDSLCWRLLKNNRWKCLPPRRRLCSAALRRVLSLCCTHITARWYEVTAQSSFLHSLLLLKRRTRSSSRVRADNSDDLHLVMWDVAFLRVWGAARSGPPEAERQVWEDPKILFPLLHNHRPPSVAPVDSGFSLTVFLMRYCGFSLGQSTTAAVSQDLRTHRLTSHIFPKRKDCERALCFYSWKHAREQTCACWRKKKKIEWRVYAELQAGFWIVTINV